MINRLEIVESTEDHIKSLLSNLRAEDEKEAVLLWPSAEKALEYSFKNSILRKTLLIDSEVAAMWGLYGVLFGPVGAPYLLTTDSITKISPFLFLRLYKNEVDEMRKFFPVLENYVDATYKGAIRMLKLAGFSISDPVKFGPSDGLFCKFQLRSN